MITTTNSSASAAAAATAPGTATTTTTPAPALEWVQCEQCKKWRTVPTSIDLASLPEQWFCTMNTWNSNYNTCDAAQEEDEDDDDASNNAPQKAGKKRKRAAPKKNSNKDSSGRTPRASKTPRVGERASKRSKNVVDYSKGGMGETGGVNRELLEQQEQDARERAQRRKAKERQAAAEAALRQQSNGVAGASVAAPALQWVQCSRCSKWRKLGIGVDSAELPEVWTCSMNDWDNVHNNCAVPQEADDTTSTSGGGANGGEYIGDGQLWTGAGAYRKIGQNKYSYRMLISTAMRQTSNTMRRTVQAQHSNEFHASSAFVDADAVWENVYNKAKVEIRESRRAVKKKNNSSPEESPNASGVEESGGEGNGLEEEESGTSSTSNGGNSTSTTTSSDSSSSSASADNMLDSSMNSDNNNNNNKRMSFKGKKYCNVGEGYGAGGQKIFSWSKIRAIGQQIAKSKTIAASKVELKKATSTAKSKKKGKKGKAQPPPPSSPPPSIPISKTDICVIASDVVSRLRKEEQQCDVLMRLLGRDEAAPAVALDEITLRRALYTVLSSAEDGMQKGRVSEYALISRQVLPISGTLPSMEKMGEESTLAACRQLVNASGSSGASGGGGGNDTLTQRLAELVRRGLVEVDTSNKETKYRKRLTGSGNTSIPFVPCASLALKVLKPWKKSFA